MDPETTEPRPQTQWVRPKGGRSRRKLKAKIEKLKARNEDLEAEILLLRTALRLGDENMIFSNRDNLRGEIHVPIPAKYTILEQYGMKKNGMAYQVIVVERELRSLLEED